VGAFIVNQFSQAEGLYFGFAKSDNLAAEPYGRPSVFARAEVLRYKCSQARRILKVSKLPYGRTRNRRARTALFDCKGQITVIFPADSSNASFDFSVEINHDVHPGREYFGLPLVVQEMEI